MARVLKHNVTLRQTLTSPVYSFLAGEELPEWAEGLVGDHLFTETEKEPVFKRVRKTGLPSAPEVPEEKKELKVPGRSSAKAKWVQFLTDAGVEFPEDASRDDLVEIAQRALPDLEV